MNEEAELVYNNLLLEAQKMNSFPLEVQGEIIQRFFAKQQKRFQVIHDGQTLGTLKRVEK